MDGKSYIEPMTQSNAQNTGRSMVDALRHPRWPSLCEVCRRWGAGRICGDCIARFTTAHPRCARCGLRTGQPLAQCGECLRSPPPFRATHCAVDYGFPWDQLIVQFKYHNQVELGYSLSRLMLRARFEIGFSADGPLPHTLLPVPLSLDRLAARGYNQAWELAQRLGAARQVPARADVLLRVLSTPAQADLTRSERLRNLRAAFMVAPAQRSWLAGREVTLVDDVMTTGATAHEAAKTLMRAGAAAVDLWVLARTPHNSA